MRRAVIYRRVSTTEQAEKGYSLEHQLGALERFCHREEIIVVRDFKEDFSAKDFERPEFNKLLDFVKQNKSKIDLLLVTKWDRFSRDLLEAMQMCNKLQKLGIEVNAIEQWADGADSGSKFLKVFNLCYAEIERETIAKRTKDGMRQAKKEGYWVGTAPYGYNLQKIGDKTTLIPNEYAVLVKEAFELIASGFYTCEEVRKMLLKKGYKRNKQCFHDMLSKVVYTGRNFLPPNDKEGALIVKAFHEPIIPIELFDRVQDILYGRRKQPKFHNIIDEMLPLRGHLICPICHGNLTGSKSTGRKGRKYYYYHCMREHCATRFRADEANTAFIEFLNTKIKIAASVKDLFISVMKDIYKQKEGDKSARLAKLGADMKVINKFIETAQDKMLSNSISLDDYNSIKKRYEEDLRAKKSEYDSLSIVDENLLEYIRFASEIIENIDLLYISANAEIKHKLIVSIFPEKLVFDKNGYRTARVNEVVSFLCRNGNGFRRNGKRKADISVGQSLTAPPLGLEPRTP